MARNVKIARWPAKVFALVVAAYLVIPALVVVPLSLSKSQFLQFPPPGYSTNWFRQFFADPEWTAALGRSLLVAVGCTVIAVPVGVLVAYALVRTRRRYAQTAEAFVMAPMMVPIVIFGFGLYLVALQVKAVGALWLVIVAHAALATPFVVVVVLAALRTLDHRLELAARVLGANPVQMFFRVVLPLIAPAVGASALLAAMLSLDEAVVSLFIVGDNAPTLPVKMFASITYELNPLVPVGATVLVGVSLLLVAGAALLAKLGMRRMGA